MRPRSLVLAFIAAAACGPQAADGAPDLERGPDLGPTAPYAGPLQLPVRTQIEWVGAAGDGPIEEAHFVDGRGTVKLDGVTLPAVVYKKIPFPGFPYTLAAIAATEAGGILIAYAYCQSTGIGLFYTETLTEQAAPQSPLSSPGSCAFGDSPSDGDARFLQPGALTYGPPIDAATVGGARVKVEGGAGTYTVDGVDYALAVFTHVDCATCGGAGWQELHVTLRKDDLLAFTILYLRADAPSNVLSNYGFRFDRPALWPPDEAIPATWTLK